MKPEDIARLIDKGFMTAEDAMRTLGPGSSLDRFLFTTTCTTCGKKVEKTLRWFDECEARCSCGGQFNMEPLREGVKLATAGEPLAVDGLRVVPNGLKKRGDEN